MVCQDTLVGYRAAFNRSVLDPGETRHGCSDYIVKCHRFVSQRRNFFSQQFYFYENNNRHATSNIVTARYLLFIIRYRDKLVRSIVRSTERPSASKQSHAIRIG